MRFKGKLYFFDFEYAGWDDPYKQYTDLVIQPENLLNYDQATILLKRFGNILNKNIDFNILIEYIFLYRLKWSIIIMNQLLNKNISKYDKQQIFLKAQYYYKLVGSIWLKG